jgi:hypothetical protein
LFPNNLFLTSTDPQSAARLQDELASIVEEVAQLEEQWMELQEELDRVNMFLIIKYQELIPPANRSMSLPQRTRDTSRLSLRATEHACSDRPAHPSRWL